MRPDRAIPDEKDKRPVPLFSQLALGLALIAFAMLAAAGLGSRLGAWNFRTGFVVLKYGAWCGGTAVLSAIVGAVFSVRRKRYLGLILGVVALACGTVAVAIPVSWRLAAGRAPRIHDITTDIVNPPRFAALLPLRVGATNSADYGGPEVAAQQRRAYPDIKTAVLNLPFDRAFNRALDTAHAMGWQIITSEPKEGRIEATDTTFWFGFVDDIVIRVTPAGYRALVDIRSASRVGISDVGTNARRIRAFLSKLGSG